MNAKTFFLKLKKKKINDAEYRCITSSAFSLEVFKGELNNYTTHTTSLITVDAIIDGKLVMSTTENLSNESIDKLIEDLIETSKYTHKKGALIYKKKSKYEQYEHFNNKLGTYPIKKKIDTIFEIEKRLKKADKRFTEIQVGYDEKEVSHEYQNTSGIKTTNKYNYYVFSAEIVIKENDETKVHNEMFINNDFAKFNIDEFVKEATKHALKKLHPVQLKSKKYNVIFAPEVTAELLSSYVSQLNAELVLKNSSWFKNKLNKNVASPLVTIFESPLKHTIDFVNSDDQGVPTQNIDLIKNGKLKTYLHNLETAKAFKVQSNGHASLTGSKIGIGAHAALFLKPGKLRRRDFFNKIKNGIYINHLEGLHAGMNAQNGNFSLKCEGMILENGKITKPLDMMTISDNLFNIFKNVKDISKNVEYIKSDVFAPCIYLNNVSISF